MSSPYSPHRSRGGDSDGEERPRNFDRRAKSKCWENAQTVPGRHPERWRKDAAGNVVCKRFCNCHGCLCFEYDHIVPYSKGGESTAENCQILQTRVNRFKSDKDHVDATQLKGYSCDVKFSGTFLPLPACEGHDVILIPHNSQYCLRIFLQKRKDSLNQVVEAYTTFELLAVFIPYTPKDKELDIIEMAVYGDVIRRGNQCRCRTFAEMLGQYKSKDRMAACKLPYNDESL